MDNSKHPRCILLFSGKRKTGKDYFTDKLFQVCNTESVALIKISMPIKIHFSKSYNLDLNDLMSSSSYKESFRSRMIEWSDEMRRKDPGIFCRSAVEMCHADRKPVWIVSDVRRKTDIAWFKEKYGDAVRTIRIEAEEKIRGERGWTFVEGVDDAVSECDLDDYAYWNWRIDNNGDEDKFNGYLLEIYHFARQYL